MRRQRSPDMIRPTSCRPSSMPLPRRFTRAASCQLRAGRATLPFHHAAGRGIVVDLVEETLLSAASHSATAATLPRDRELRQPVKDMEVQIRDETATLARPRSARCKRAPSIMVAISATRMATGCLP
jgi:hypothetical protein